MNRMPFHRRLLDPARDFEEQQYENQGFPTIHGQFTNEAIGRYSSKLTKLTRDCLDLDPKRRPTLAALGQRIRIGITEFLQKNGDEHDEIEFLMNENTKGAPPGYWRSTPRRAAPPTNLPPPDTSDDDSSSDGRPDDGLSDNAGDDTSDADDQYDIEDDNYDADQSNSTNGGAGATPPSSSTKPSGQQQTQTFTQIRGESRGDTRKSSVSS